MLLYLYGHLSSIIRFHSNTPNVLAKGGGGGITTLETNEWFVDNTWKEFSDVLTLNIVR